MLVTRMLVFCPCWSTTAHLHGGAKHHIRAQHHNRTPRAYVVNQNRKSKSNQSILIAGFRIIILSAEGRCFLSPAIVLRDVVFSKRFKSRTSYTTT